MHFCLLLEPKDSFSHLDRGRGTQTAWRASNLCKTEETQTLPLSIPTYRKIEMECKNTAKRVCLSINQRCCQFSNKVGLNCKSLPSIFLTLKRQIALYSPCRLVGRSVGVTINFPSPNVFLHFLRSFSSSSEKNNNNNNDHLVDCPTQLICTWVFICVP